MEKWIYEKYLDFNKEKTVEELTIEQMAYSNLECNDRAFANEFEASMSGYYLNELFENIRIIIANTEEKEKAIKGIIDNFENCENAYKFIKREIGLINNNSRVYDEIRDIKKQLQTE